MSNYRAIAAITASLRNLLSDVDHGIPSVIGDVKVTTKPLDKTREGLKGNQLNIYLYQFLPNPAWRNARDPKKGPQGAGGPPPVALDLYYLLTAYGEGDDEVKGHLLLGKAMDILNEHPRFPVEELRIAVEDNDLYMDAGLITIVPQFLPLEELSKFWTSASTGFRASMVYKVSVILIDNPDHLRSALPGYRAPNQTIRPGTASRPAITNLIFANGLDRAQIGSAVRIEGRDLGAKDVTVLLASEAAITPTTIVPESIEEDAVSFTVPREPGRPGAFAVWLRLERDGQLRDTNKLPMILIATVLPDSLEVVTDEATATISLECRPAVTPDQRIYLLLGNQAFTAPPRTTEKNRLSFTFAKPEPGAYYIRLRIDGIDSNLINFDTNPPSFDQRLKVTIP